LQRKTHPKCQVKGRMLPGKVFKKQPKGTLKNGKERKGAQKKVSFAGVSKKSMRWSQRNQLLKNDVLGGGGDGVRPRKVEGIGFSSNQRTLYLSRNQKTVKNGKRGGRESVKKGEAGKSACFSKNHQKAGKIHGRRHWQALDA